MVLEATHLCIFLLPFARKQINLSIWAVQFYLMKFIIFYLQILVGGLCCVLSLYIFYFFIFFKICIVGCRPQLLSAFLAFFPLIICLTGYQAIPQKVEFLTNLCFLEKQDQSLVDLYDAYFKGRSWANLTSRILAFAFSHSQFGKRLNCCEAFK